MTTQEQQLISGLIERVSRTQLAEKDPDAEQMLNDGLGRNPDSLYILAQTVLVQQIALEQVQRQLADLRGQQAQQPKKSTSFLGSIFGHNEPATSTAPPPPPSGYQTVPGTGQQAGYGAPAFGQPGYGAPSSVPGSMMGGAAGGGFLRGALQTATGVAAGALAFEGIESLLHGFGGESRGFGDLGGGRPEEIVNNYYGDADRGGDTGLSGDIEDRRGDSGDDGGDRLAAADDTGFGSGDDTTGLDDASGDDGSDDTGGDVFGGDDSGGGDNFGGSDDFS